MAVVVKYFDLCGFKIFGRGGVVRIFCDTNKIAYEDKDVDFHNEWPTLKPQVIANNENPTGQLPILYDGDFQLSECNAIIRYLARKNNVQQDAKTEAVSDMLLDKIVPLRDSTITAAFATDDSVKAKHKEDRKEQYKMLDQVLQKHASASGLVSQTAQPTAGDVGVYCIAYDDAQLFGKPDGEYPALKKLTDNLNQNEAVKSWLEKRNYGPNPLL